MYPMIQQEHLLPKRKNVTTSHRVEVHCVEVHDAHDLENASRHSQKYTKSQHKSLFRSIFAYCRETWTGVKESLDSEVVEERAIKKYQVESIQALCQLTKFTEHELKRIYRGFKADCPSGIIREDTFKTIYSQFFPQGGNFHYKDNFIKTLSMLTRGTIEEKLRWIFSLYDINRDGQITVDEMTEIVNSIYDLLGSFSSKDSTIDYTDRVREAVNKIFNKMDLNRDGVITLDEFMECCHNDQVICSSISAFNVIV